MKLTTARYSSARAEPISDLIEAVMSRDLSALKRLVRAGAKVNQRYRDGFTLFMHAAAQGDTRLTEYLIREGADVNLRNDIGQTALMIAALNGHKSIIEQLVLAGADLRTVDNEKKNAIAWAASRGDFPEVISMLAVLGADYNARDVRGITPLMRAALLGFAESVGMLLTLGADETVKYQDKTAYKMATEKGHKKVCEAMKAILANRPKGHAL